MRIFFLCLAFLFVGGCILPDSGDEKKETKDTVVDKSSEIRQTTADSSTIRADTIFRALGTEPFWAVFIIDKKEIVFQPSEGEKISVPYVAPEIMDSLSQRFQSTTAQHSIFLVIKKQNCSDGMSDIIHPYKVDVTIDQKKYAGCGKYIRSL